MITKVFNRLRNVLVLIVEANGKNDLVETKRGKNFYMLDLPIDLTEDTPTLIPESSAAELFQEEPDLVEEEVV